MESRALLSGATERCHVHRPDHIMAHNNLSQGRATKWETDSEPEKADPSAILEQNPDVLARTADSQTSQTLQGLGLEYDELEYVSQKKNDSTSPILKRGVFALGHMGLLQLLQRVSSSRHSVGPWIRRILAIGQYAKLMRADLKFRLDPCAPFYAPTGGREPGARPGPCSRGGQVMGFHVFAYPRIFVAYFRCSALLITVSRKRTRFLGRRRCGIMFWSGYKSYQNCWRKIQIYCTNINYL